MATILLRAPPATCLRVARHGIWLLVFAVGCGSSEDPGWTDDFDYGRYPVGFRSETIIRESADGVPRVLTLSMWYPATSVGQGAAVTVGALFELARAEEQLKEADGLSLERGFVAAMTGDSTAIPVERASAALASPTFARHDALPAAGPFPIALWSSRHATIMAQAPLSETLASHGFIVATVWSSEPPLAFIWEDRSPEDKTATLEVQTEDLYYALSYLKTDSTAAAASDLILAWSYGGQTAARLSARDSSVRAIISLDANVLPVDTSEHFEFHNPLVYFGRTMSADDRDRFLQFRTPWITVSIPELAHGNFNAMEGYLPGVYGATNVFPWSLGGQFAREGYRALVRMVVTAAGAYRDDGMPLVTELSNRLRDHGAAISATVRNSPE